MRSRRRPHWPTRASVAFRYLYARSWIRNRRDGMQNRGYAGAVPTLNVEQALARRVTLGRETRLTGWPISAIGGNRRRTERGTRTTRNVRQKRTRNMQRTQRARAVFGAAARTVRVTGIARRFAHVD